MDVSRFEVMEDPQSFNVRVRAELTIDNYEWVHIREQLGIDEVRRLIAERITDELLKELKRSDI